MASLVCLCGHIAVGHDVIRTAVMSGQRPDVDAVAGPDPALVKHIRDCIERCWHQSPDRRPSFAGRYNLYANNSYVVTDDLRS